MSPSTPSARCSTPMTAEREVAEPRDNRMAQVSVTINGRQYRMACEDGQENHLDPARQGHRRAHRAAARQFRRDRRFPADRDGGAHGRRRAGRSRPQDAPAGGGDRAPCRMPAWWPPTARSRPRPRSSPRSMPPPSGSRAMTRKLNQTVGNSGSRVADRRIESFGGGPAPIVTRLGRGAAGCDGVNTPGALRS